MKRAVIGVDEAGRGPLAGPVAVGAVLVSSGFKWDEIPGVADSKQLSVKKREAIFVMAQALSQQKKLFYVVSLAGAASIDREGISIIIKKLIAKNLATLTKKAALTPEQVFIKLDGALKAPDIYPHQATIIKGDVSEREIGLASILAKVTRDAYMVRKSAEPIFAPYSFAIHKGYGTKTHREAIAQHGFSPEHRQSYCKNIKML